MISTASAAAHPNIAFIKYWGNKDQKLRIPAHGSLSMNLKELETRTSVSFDPSLAGDQLILNGIHEEGGCFTASEYNAEPDQEYGRIKRLC